MTGEIDRGDGRDKILSAADQSPAIRTPEVLGAEADKVRPLVVEAAHGLDGVIHIGRIDKGGDAVLMSDGRQVPQGNGAFVTIEVSRHEERDGVRAESPLDLFPLGARFRTDLNDARTR